MPDDPPVVDKPVDITPSPKPLELQLPQLMFVKEGTRTAKSEQQIAEDFADAEQRRDSNDAMHKLASIPIEQGGAKLYTHQFTSRPDIPKVYLLLEYQNRQGSRVWPYECIAEITIDDFADPDTLTLHIVCPRCPTLGKHIGECQLKIWQKNKFWALKPGAGLPTFMFKGKKYRSAGVIEDCESFRCPDCFWRAVIDKNVIREL